ncbi:S24 family peptidase [Parashewanella curva]|nr:S24 family peptidase [Parashewanella curva]
MIGNESKIRFSERLNAILDEHNFPPKNMGRISWLANMFSTTHKGAGNWVNGRAIPSRKTLKIMCEKFNVNEEWLQFGDKAGAKSKIINVPMLTKSEILNYVKQQQLNFPNFVEVQDNNSSRTFAVDLTKGEFELDFLITQRGMMIFDPDRPAADKMFALVNIDDQLSIKRLIEFDKERFAVISDNTDSKNELHTLNLPDQLVAIMTEIKF